MEQMQFTAVVLLTLLLFKLLILPNKVAVTPVVGKARWQMALGIAMLDLQFILQYTLKLRAMGVTQAVMVNLLLFIPCTWTISMALINLQTQGRVLLLDKILGGITWIIVILLLTIAAAIDGEPFITATPELYWAEVISSILYFMTQAYYAYRMTVNLHAMRVTLRNYYDHDMSGMILWMRYSTILLTLLALMVPHLIFVKTQGLAFFTLIFFGGMFYLVDTFCNYMVSSAPKKMLKAEETDDSAPLDTHPSSSDTPSHLPPSSPSLTGCQEDGTIKCSGWTSSGVGLGPLSALSSAERELASTEDTSLQRVEHAVEQWKKAGGYRQSGLNIPNAADQIGIPRYLLSTWLKQQGLTYATWMTDLRVDEARQVLKQHPEWNNEAVASYCGFSDRTYFQKKFKEQTGLSPAEYVKRYRTA